MRNGNEYEKYVTEKRIYIMSIHGTETARLHGETTEYVPFRISQDLENGHWPDLPFRKRVPSEAIGKWPAGDKPEDNTADYYQTDSENQEKYNICFCIIFRKKKMNNT
ncbi:MAG: hypothetical protein ACLUVG_04675 [Phocaeicola vulgatus]